MTDEEIAAIAAKHRMAKFPNLALTRRRVYIEKANGKLRPLTHYGLYRLAWADVRRARWGANNFCPALMPQLRAASAMLPLGA